MAGKTVEESKRTKLYSVVREVLGNEYTELTVSSFTATEDFRESTSTINCSFLQASNEKKQEKSIDFTGRGTVDALFNGLIRHYSEDFKSLKNITFVGFDVKPDFKTTKNSDSDASIEVVLEFFNSSKKVMTFRDKNRSIASAAVRAIFKTIEFYINSELAFKKLKFLISDAESRSRGDLLALYRYQISAIVSVTSYEGVC